jgi:hypothetical protein
VLFMGLIGTLEWESENGPLSAGPSSFLTLCITSADFRHPGDQVEGKTPKALALVTACVRLWTLSLP